MRVVCVTCEKYYALVPGFCFFLEKFWPDRPYYLDILANTSQPKLEELPYGKVYVGQDMGWATNMLAYLEQLKDELVLILLDDYFLCESANTKALEQAVALMENDNNINYTNLRPWSDDILYQSEVLFGSWTLWQKITNKPIVGEYNKEAACYLLSLQPGVWRTKSLQGLLCPGEDGWQTEILGTKRARETGGKMLGVLGPFILPYINICCHGVWRKDGDTARDWIIKQVGKDHWVYKELDAALSGEGLK